MATIDDFSQTELRQIQHAPIYVIAGAIASQPEGVTSSMVEMIEGVEKFAQSMAAAGDELLSAIFANIDQTQPDDFDITQVSDPAFHESIMEKGIQAATAATSLLASKATTNDAETFSTLLIDAARAAVHATRTGGILGFGSVEVTLDEAAYIARLTQALNQQTPLP